MKKLVMCAFLLLFIFISSCNLIGSDENSLPASNRILSVDAGDNLLLQVYSFPPPDNIGEDTPINLEVYITNKGKDDVSGIIEVLDNIFDSSDYGGIEGTRSAEFFVSGIEKGQSSRPKQIDVLGISGIEYRNAKDLRNVVFSIVLKTSKKKELLSKAFCLKQRIDENIKNCDSHPRLSFDPLDPVVSLSDFEFFGSTGTTVDKIKFKMNINENTRCTIIKEDLSNPTGEEAALDQNQIVGVSSYLVQSNVGFDCKVNPTKSSNQKIIICDNANDLIFTDSYYGGERIKTEINYGCSYLFTTNIDLLKKEEVR